MRKTTPSLNALRAFEAAARHGSFARAAKELFVTPSAVSQQISALEKRLGIPLFDRVKQRIHLTEAGSSYRLALVAAFDRIESATVDLISHGGGASLRIGALPSLANDWLIPRLRRFIRQHPTIRLQVVSLDLDFASAERSPDLEGRLIDIGLFYGDGHWPGLAAERLMEERLIAVTAPLTHVDDGTPATQLIEELPLLQHSTRPESWDAWFRAQKQPARTARGPSFEHFHMLVEAAKAGLGIALVPDVYVQSELRLRTLVPVSEFALVATRAYYIVFDPRREGEPAVRKFRDWLLVEVGLDGAA
ncbi:MAG: LysR substrate-binding domain-containing protein [Planctomycetota bacterium]